LVKERFFIKSGVYIKIPKYFANKARVTCIATRIIAEYTKNLWFFVSHETALYLQKFQLILQQHPKKVKTKKIVARMPLQ